MSNDDEYVPMTQDEILDYHALRNGEVTRLENFVNSIDHDSLKEFATNKETTSEIPNVRKAAFELFEAMQRFRSAVNKERNARVCVRYKRIP